MARGLRLAVVTAALSVLACSASAEEFYLTNLEMLERTVKAAADSMEVSPIGMREDDLHILVTGAGEASWLLESALKEKLLSKGWRIRATSKPDSGNVDDSTFLLKLRVIGLGLTYGKSWRRYLFGGKVVERVARVSVYYELVDRIDQKIIISSNAKSEARDVVPASLLPALSDAKYTFASPELKKSQWDRYLEGGLVLAIVGVLIYLFYSNKTAS